MDNLKSLLDYQLLEFGMTNPSRDWSILPKDLLKKVQKEIIEHRKMFVNSILKEIKDYYLHKLPKEKTFDNSAISKKESLNSIIIYNTCVKQIKNIIQKG